MKEYKINKELSKEVYESCKSDLRPRECYYNIAKVVTNYAQHIIRYRDMQVVFGAWKVNAIKSRDVYAKHCFLLLGDEVIDPTFFVNDDTQESRYIVIQSFTMRDYIRELIRSNGDTDLTNLVNPIYDKAYSELISKGIVLIG